MLIFLLIGKQILWFRICVVIERFWPFEFSRCIWRKFSFAQVVNLSLIWVFVALFWHFGPVLELLFYSNTIVFVYKKQFCNCIRLASFNNLAEQRWKTSVVIASSPLITTRVRVPIFQGPKSLLFCFPAGSQPFTKHLSKTVPKLKTTQDMLWCVHCTAVCGWFSIRFKNGSSTKNSIPFRSNSKAWTIHLKEVFIAKWTKMASKTNENEWTQKSKLTKRQIKRY